MKPSFPVATNLRTPSHRCSNHGGTTEEGNCSYLLSLSHRVLYKPVVSILNLFTVITSKIQKTTSRYTNARFWPEKYIKKSPLWQMPPPWSYLDEGLSLALFILQRILGARGDKTLKPDEGISARLGRGHHIEGHGERTALVYVVHPETGSGELPLDITVTLVGVGANNGKVQGHSGNHSQSNNPTSLPQTFSFLLNAHKWQSIVRLKGEEWDCFCEVKY